MKRVKNIFIDRTGEEHWMKDDYQVEIIECFGSLNCTIRFNDSRKTILKNVFYGNIKRGTIKNPYHPSVHGVGYLGIGQFSIYTEGKENKNYRCWKSMLGRCYALDRYNPTYIGCSVDERWHNFQNFAEWFYENWKPWMDKTWHLDKDILIKGNKIYSPETCAFVPIEINSLLTKTGINRGKYPIGVTFCKEKWNKSHIHKKRY